MPNEDSGSMTGITTAEQLVARFESSTLDYKTRYELLRPTIRYDIAKDVAAFANGYGGTIVIGVEEQAGEVVALPGVADVQTLTAAVAASLLQLCEPIPSTPVEHAIAVTPAQAARLLAPGAVAPRTDVTLVTLNVRPDGRSPIGVHPVDAAGAPLAHAFRFPVRIDDQTRFLDPTELPMWMNNHERRIAIQLREAFAGAPVDVVVYQLTGVSMTHQDEQRMTLAGLDEARGILEMRHPKMPGVAHVPFTFVRSVWRDSGDSVWRIAIGGWLFPNPTASGLESKFRPSMLIG